jgi:hypothetical protein
VKPTQVLLIAEAHDIHALAVASALDDAGAKPVVFDTSEYPRHWRIAFSYGDDAVVTLERLESATRLDAGGGWSADIKDLSGIWYRRVQPFQIAAQLTDQQVRHFAASECRHAFFAMLDECPNVINSPWAETVADRKPHQLARAIEAGMNVPPTLVSSDPTEIVDFRERLGADIVFKILTNTRTQFTETRVLEHSDLDRIDATRHAPTIFQKKLDADHHLRVTVIDDHMFAARLRTMSPDARHDWRLDHGVRIEAMELSADQRVKILDLMRRLGLRFGALDFLVTPDGCDWFLEVNPAGQFLFVELETGQPISRTLAEALMRQPA